MKHKTERRVYMVKWLNEWLENVWKSSRPLFSKREAMKQVNRCLEDECDVHLLTYNSKGLVMRECYSPYECVQVYYEVYYE